MRLTTRNVIVGVFFSLVLLIFLTPLWANRDLLFGFVTTKAFYFRILVELALPLYVYLVIAEPDLRPKLKQPIAVALLAFVVINVIATFAGINAEHSMWGNFERMGGTYYLLHLTLLYFYVLLVGQLRGTWRLWLLRLFLVVPVLVCIDGLSGMWGGPALSPDFSLPSRLSATLGNPIYVGTYLMTPLFVALCLIFQEKKTWLRVAYGAAAFLFLITIFPFSADRGAFLGLLVGLFCAGVVAVLFTQRQTVRRWGMAALAGGLVLAGLAFTIGKTLLPASSQFGRLVNLSDNDTKARIIQWGIALKGYPEHALFGVGPENYYYISNKYYNPEIYQYDPGSFDKPHNYLLELFVTLGPLGLLTYIAVIGAAMWALYRAFRTGFLGLAAFAILTGALIAYQFQNLTVFDSIGSSIVLFVLLGIIGYMWHAVSQARAAAAAEPAARSARAAKPRGPAAVAVAAALVIAVVAGACIYLTNYEPIQVAAATTNGVAFAQQGQPQQAADYFQQATTLPGNFDETEVANRFSDFASGFAQTPAAATSQYRALAQQELAASIAYSEQAVADDATNAHTWINLATNYIVDAAAFGKVDAGMQNAIAMVEQLAPQRVETQLIVAKFDVIEGRLSDAENVLRAAVTTFPTNLPIHHQLALVLRAEKKLPDAVQMFLQALKLGFVPQTFADVQWVGEYYASQHEYGNEVQLYQATTQVLKTDINLYVALANAYQANGQHDQALSLYNQIVAQYPQLKSQMPGISG